jgi:phosphotransferase system enzyme I (PtsI)
MKKQPGDLSKKREIMLNGVPASPGIVIGPCYLHLEASWEPEAVVVTRGKIPEQIKRFRQSIGNVHANLTETYQKTHKQLGSELAEILEMQIAFLEDQVFLNEVEDIIEKKRYDAAYATFVIFRRKKEYFLKSSNEYFRDRAFDIQSLKEMVVKNLIGRDQAVSISIEKPSVVIADNLTPTDTVELYKQQVLGLATNTGGKTSHTAIVARSLSVPAVVGLTKITESVKTGDTVILDGNKGKVIVNPTPGTIESYQEQRRIFCIYEEELLKESSLQVQTKDGKRIYVHANVEFENEVSQVLQVGADGIGLFRTEGHFMSRREIPSEEEQTSLYYRIAEKMYPKKVVIRTLDIGGDKMIPGLRDKEDNPFLGWRAIRFWLDHKTGFLAQLKAILRANVKGNVQILLPMISGLGEIQQIRELIEEAKELLRKEGKAFGESIELGIMIEIPSVVMLADVLAYEVDFFSIGTNDLVQYTLAVDRGNTKVAKLYSHFHPAVLRMLKITLDAGQKANIPVGMCGEMAGDSLAIPLLLAMGFDYLSASHALIPEVKKIIRELSISDCETLYEEVKNIMVTREVIKEVDEFFHQHFSEIFSKRE